MNQTNRQPSNRWPSRPVHQSRNPNSQHISGNTPNQLQILQPPARHSSALQRNSCFQVNPELVQAQQQAVSANSKRASWNSRQNQYGQSDQATLIRDLNSGDANKSVIGVIIRIDDVKLFDPKEPGDSARGVINFTVRDSPFDFINVSVWGRTDSIQAIEHSKNIGDIVKVNGCSVKDKTDQDVKFRAWTPSLYSILVNEHYSHSSNIELYEGSDIQDYIRLIHAPLRVPSTVYNLSEISNNINNLHSELISFTAAVRHVGTARYITSRSTGKQLHLAEIKLFDQRVDIILLNIWDRATINFTNHWTPNETILSIINVKVQYDDYKKCPVASTTSKSIIIMNPDSPEGASLYQHARDKIWPDEPDSVPENQQVDIQNATTMTVVEFADCIDELPIDKLFTYCSIEGYLSMFDVDGSLDAVLGGKCLECGKKLSSVVRGVCSNYDCIRSDIGDMNDDEVYYSLRVDLSDLSGTASNCKLPLDVINKMLKFKPGDYAMLTDEQKTAMKWDFLFERCTCVVKASRLEGNQINFTILDFQRH